MAADGQVLIDSKINTKGINQGVADIKQQFNGMAQHTKVTAAEINNAINTINTTGTADGMADSFDAESAKIKEILADTQRSQRSQAMSIAAIYRKQGMTQKEALSKAWDLVERRSAVGSKNVKDDIEGIGRKSKSVGSLMSSSIGMGIANIVKRIGTLVASLFAVRQVVQFAKDSVVASMQMQNALMGLQSIVEGQGRSFSNARGFIEEYISDGLIPATNAITAYKNLAARGYDDNQIRKVMIALKDASAFGRQASYTMGEAVQSATEGLKNENSVLVDNAGVTKNVAKMWEDYAESIGTTSDKLTTQQKIQAEVNGILEESKYQAGDAEKVTGTLSGQLSQLSFNFEQLKVAVGDGIAPIAEVMLPTINTAITKLTEFANAFAAVIRTLTGTAATAEDLANSYDNATESVEDLTDATIEANNAAKKSLAGFDELNRLQAKNSSSSSTSDSNSGDSGGSTTSTTPGKELDTSKIQKVADIIKKIAEYAPVIATALGGLKLGSFLTDLATANIETKTLKESLGLLGKKTLITLEIAVAVTSIALFTKAVIDAFANGLDGKNFLEILGSGAVGTGVIAALGAQLATWISKAFAGSAVANALTTAATNLGVGSVGAVGAALAASIAGIVLGIPTMILGIYDALKDGLDWLNATLIAGSATAIGASIGTIIGTITGGPIGAGVGALIGLIVGLVTDFVLWFWEKYEEIQAWFTNLPVLVQGLIAAVLAVFAAVNMFGNALMTILAILGVLVVTVIKEWDNIVAVITAGWTKIKEFFAPAVQWFSELFGSVFQTLSDIFYNIGVIVGGCWEIIKIGWSELCSLVGTWAADAWERVKTTLGPAAQWINEKIIQPVSKAFSGLWSKVSEWASAAWKDIKDTFSGLGAWFKGILNSIISLLNSMSNGLFGGINDLLSGLKNFEVAGITPFSGIKTISVPKIPYLAQGAVLPPNKPFMAVVGDQKHGTNVEAPLATIQEAVAIVMEDMIKSNIAGHEATVAVLKEILEAVLGIHIGDDVFGQAVARYNAKMATIRGGV